MATHCLSTFPSQVSLSLSTTPTSSSPSLSSPFLHLPFSSLKSQNPWLGSLTKPNPTRHCFFTVRSSPATANGERVSNGQVLKWSSSALLAFSRADVETRKLRLEECGTESLLLSIILGGAVSDMRRHLFETLNFDLPIGTSLASRFLVRHGVTYSKAVKEAKNILGDDDDRTSIHMYLAAEVQRAVDWAVDEKLKAGGSGMITTTDLLLGIWFTGESPGHTILVNLEFDEEKAEQLKYLSSQPGFDE